MKRTDTAGERHSRLMLVPVDCVEWGVETAGVRAEIAPASDERTARAMADRLNREPGNRLMHHAVMRITQTPWRRL